MGGDNVKRRDGELETIVFKKKNLHSKFSVGSNPTGVILALVYARRLFAQFLPALALTLGCVTGREKLVMLPSFCTLVCLLQSDGCVTEGT